MGGIDGGGGCDGGGGGGGGGCDGGGGDGCDGDGGGDGEEEEDDKIGGDKLVIIPRWTYATNKDRYVTMYLAIATTFTNLVR